MRPAQSLKDMAEGWQERRALTSVLASLCQRDQVDQLRTERRSFLLVLSQSICLPLSAHPSPDSWQVSLSFLNFLSSSSLISLCPKRAVILDYLVQRCYTRTARAFAADSTIRHLDADGDELRRPSGEDDSPGITEDALHQADLRQSAYFFLILYS